MTFCLMKGQELLLVTTVGTFITLELLSALLNSSCSIIVLLSHVIGQRLFSIALVVAKLALVVPDPLVHCLLVSLQVVTISGTIAADFTDKVSDGGVLVSAVLPQDMPLRSCVWADVALVGPPVCCLVPNVAPSPVVLQLCPFRGSVAAVGTLEAIDPFVDCNNVSGQVVPMRSLVWTEVAIVKIHFSFTVLRHTACETRITTTKPIGIKTADHDTLLVQLGSKYKLQRKKKNKVRRFSNTYQSRT